jgi:hypothetical protein
LRKYMIVAVAAIAAIAFASVALAQTPDPQTMSVKVAPKKAGTKNKPKNSSIVLDIQNNEPKRTLGKLEITSPKTFKLSTKGLTKCSASVLENQGPSACPRKSIVGRGTAAALAAVNGPNPTPLTFDVTAVVTGKKNIGFHLHAHEAPLDVLSPGVIKGRKLTITVPDAAQHLGPVWNGLKSIHTTLKAKKGKHMLASTTGCVKKKHTFSTKLTFVDNTVPGTAGTVTVKASSKCSK